MNSDSAPMRIHEDDEVVVALRQAVQSGDLDTISRLVADHPGLAGARLLASNGSTSVPLHIVANWPGYFPNGPETVRLLISAGADPAAHGTGDDDTYGETPLHWAASSDDVEVAAALIDGGADINAPGGSITGGSPLSNAVGYACWHVACLLEAHGARIVSLAEAAALGNRQRAEELLGTDPPPTAADIDEAFWQACHGGQYRMAQYLLDRGANINAKPGYAHINALEVATQAGTQRMQLATMLRDRGAAAT